MHVDSRYLVGHNVSPGGSGERSANSLTRVAGYRPRTEQRDEAELFAQPRTLRIRHADSLNFSTANSMSPLEPLYSAFV
jgi:hypothetical protein